MKGAAKGAIGKATGNDKLGAEGAVDKAKGALWRYRRREDCIKMVGVDAKPKREADIKTKLPTQCRRKRGGGHLCGFLCFEAMIGTRAATCR